jgi:hypothetical protein
MTLISIFSADFRNMPFNIAEKSAAAIYSE